jgi:hypothetical protein
MQTWQVFEVLHYQKHPQDILFAEAENAELLKKKKEKSFSESKL